MVAQTVPPVTTPDGGMSEHTCDGCEPPLVYQGGQVMDTTGPAGVTITPIFWAPEGYAFPDGYQTLIERYIHDIAADSGASSNVYSLAPEYSVLEGEFAQDLSYRFTAGETIVDTNAFPVDGCQPQDGFTACITDSELRDELQALVAANGLDGGLAHFYPVFFPPESMTMDLDESNSIDGYCGYHRAFGEGDREIVYGNEPFDEQGCGQAHSPNGNLAADGAIGVLSHEIMEALTDPQEVTTWNDGTGHEIGDICAEFFGAPLGYTDDTDQATSGYNQMINGNPYYTQTEFSNLAFAAFGPGAGCQQSADAATGAATTAPIGVMLGTASPNVLDADGTSTTNIEAIVSAPDGSAVAGDRLAFSTKIIDGTGTCGELSASSVSTDENGFASLTYTASNDDLICGVVIIDGLGGQAATASIYQGSYADQAPTATAQFPEQLVAGADPITFDITFTNPGRENFTSAEISFTIFPTDGTTDDITADQVAIRTSFDGADGEFQPLELSGSTLTDGSIQGTIEGVSLASGASQTVTFELAIADSVPTSATPSVSFESYLDLINPATGAGTNLADTLSSDVLLVAAAGEVASTDTTLDTTASSEATAATSPSDSTPSSSSSSTIWLVIVVVILLLAAAVAIAVIRRRSNTTRA